MTSERETNPTPGIVEMVVEESDKIDENQQQSCYESCDASGCDCFDSGDCFDYCDRVPDPD